MREKEREGAFQPLHPNDKSQGKEASGGPGGTSASQPHGQMQLGIGTMEAWVGASISPWAQPSRPQNGPDAALLFSKA